MVNQAEEPLIRITINLFEADVRWLKDYIGPGWQGMIRDMVRHSVIGLQYTPEEADAE